MNADMDYYATLGVLPDADQEVIAAVYRALIKKWHPDISKADPNVAAQKTRALNEAFEVLSDPSRRKIYDDERAKSVDHAASFENDGDADGEFDGVADWDFVKSYYPEVEAMRLELRKFSSPLALSFQAALLQHKSFSMASALRDKLLNGFLVRHFGSNKRIREFAKQLILSQKIGPATELNRLIRIAGSPANWTQAGNIIQTLFDKHK